MISCIEKSWALDGLPEELVEFQLFVGKVLESVKKASLDVL